jgi:4-hydroxy-2-oxoheptanedioate aldolase|tara:strand:- start:413 stop:1201 length:789 start_codon:yes stop_codon:yes gene_type:complete
MNSNILKLIDNKKPIINGWLSLPNSFTAEAMSKMGWDTITIDLQHGQNDYSSSIPMIQAMSNSNVSIMARVPWNEPGIIMKMLDLGVLGIISPMINNKKDCEKFVSYCYYPPLGQRSFGPMRALLNYGPNYFKNANKSILSFAMIETKEAVNNLDEILSVPNLSGVYIGPADMSSSYGLSPKFDVKEDPVYSNIKLIAQKAKEYNKIAGIHNGTVNYAKEMIELGYKLVTISSDFRSMTAHAQGIVDEMKNTNENHSSNSSY